MVDLSLSTEEILELMLTQLLPSVYKQQLIQHLQLQNDKQLLQDKLVSEVVRGPAAPTSPGLTSSVRANEIMFLHSVCILALHHVSSEISAAVCQY